MSSEDAYNNEEILHLLAEDNEFAFTQLFSRYRERIYGLALKFLKSNFLAEEILQDVFLKIWLKRKHLHEVEHFEAYLMVMARNFVFDRIKKVSYEVTAKRELSRREYFTDNADHRLLQQQYQLLIDEAINLLSPQQKQVYKLVKEQCLSHEAAAKKLNISRLTVKRHMANALKFIRWYLQKNGGPMVLWFLLFYKMVIK